MKRLSQCCSLQQRAAILCGIPIFYGCLILSGFLIDSASALFVGLCLITGSFCIGTGITGIVASLTRSGVGLGVVLLALVLENILCILCALTLLIWVTFVNHGKRHFNKNDMTAYHPFQNYIETHESPLLKFLLEHQDIFHLISGSLLVLGLLGFWTYSTLSDLKLDCDVNELILEQKGFLPQVFPFKRSPNANSALEKSRKQKTLCDENSPN